MQGSSNPVGEAAEVPDFAAPYAPSDESLAPSLLNAAARDEAAEARIDARARRLVETIRSRAGGLGGVADFLHAYSLSTKEGLALMVRRGAAAVLDAVTADLLIEDKLRPAIGAGKVG
jgi:RHH-type proline utilization regulon transcriptional repressor/proline dehydrogenase/delta 1-pyrroline-5-carboxylate dehydrogenase